MHWKNSNFGYAYFIFSSCHTYIEAHRKCVQEIEDRELALEDAQANALLSGTLDTIRVRSLKQSEDLITQCTAELEFLRKCKTKLETQIGFVPTMSHYQDNQREEWKLELMFRVENYLCTMGAIPTDQFSTMRLHPDFQSDIYPLINKLRDTLGTVAGEKSALFHSNLNLQLLLE